MTDLSNIDPDDLKAARKYVADYNTGAFVGRPGHAAAVSVLEALMPEPQTPSDELYDLSHKAYDDGNEHLYNRLHTIAVAVENLEDDLTNTRTRAEQLEAERDEARDLVNHLTQDRDYWRDSERQAIEERDEARADVDRLKNQLTRTLLRMAEPHTITTPADLDSLPTGSVVLDAGGGAWQKYHGGWKCIDIHDWGHKSSSVLGTGPATVVDTPQENA